MSGFVGDLSREQEDNLNKFRDNVKDLLKPKEGDHFLLRWLRARDFNIKKAESMLREAYAWRQQIGADKILDEYEEPEVIQKYRTGGTLPGTDKKGCPIYIDPYGLVDMKGLLRSVKKQDVMRKFVHEMERLTKLCEEETEKQSTGIHQVSVIYDLNKFGVKHIWKPAVDMYLSIVRAAESIYPEMLRKVFVINAPKLFPIVWSLVKPLLHEATSKKVVVLSGNYKEALLKEIDADKLPVCYGGTLTDPDGDPRCKTWICQGGTVPKEYYNQAAPKVTMTTVTVGRGSTLQLEYQVHHANSVIRYEFHSEDHDIGFGVFRKTTMERQKANEMETILSTERTNSQLVPEDGFVECEKAGTYVVRFDNTYSWARSKKVYYLIEVLEPDDEDDDDFVMAEEEFS